MFFTVTPMYQQQIFTVNGLRGCLYICLHSSPSGKQWSRERFATQKQTKTEHNGEVDLY